MLVNGIHGHLPVAISTSPMQWDSNLGTKLRNTKTEDGTPIAIDMGSNIRHAFYHCRGIGAQDGDGLWKQSFTHIVLDSAPLALPLGIVKDESDRDNFIAMDWCLYARLVQMTLYIPFSPTDSSASFYSKLRITIKDTLSHLNSRALPPPSCLKLKRTCHKHNF
jgi:hypothetical protein